MPSLEARLKSLEQHATDADDLQNLGDQDLTNRAAALLLMHVEGLDVPEDLRALLQRASVASASSEYAWPVLDLLRRVAPLCRAALNTDQTMADLARMFHEWRTVWVRVTDLVSRLAN